MQGPRSQKAARIAALVDAIAAEVDTGDDCRELEAMHAAQRGARKATATEPELQRWLALSELSDVESRKLSDVERVERRLGLCLRLPEICGPLAAPLFAQLEHELRMGKIAERPRH